MYHILYTCVTLILRSHCKNKGTTLLLAVLAISWCPITKDMYVWHFILYFYHMWFLVIKHFNSIRAQPLFLVKTIHEVTIGHAPVCASIRDEYAQVRTDINIPISPGEYCYNTAPLYSTVEYCKNGNISRENEIWWWYCP